jgi:hypothetical protein
MGLTVRDSSRVAHTTVEFSVVGASSGTIALSGVPVRFAPLTVKAAVAADRASPALATAQAYFSADGW